MMELALLLQAGDPTGTGVIRFFIGFFLILFVVGGAASFTYWISKDE